MSQDIIGYIHSYETFGAVDGPGVRFIVFLQGCPLRCLYCHNADTWKMNEGTKITAKDLFDKIIQYKNFIKKGGVTFSGGEPLLQHEFVTEVIKLCKKAGLHTAIDTSGGVELEICKDAINEADMILLDIKDIDKEDCIKLTGQPNTNALAILNYCDYIGKDVWIRHVLVPQYTMDTFKLYRLARVLSWYNCIKKVEIIPFHKMGEYKWDYIKEEYKLKDIPPASVTDVEQAKEIMTQYGLPL
ncbi:MAG: pyruvate formate-lyase-activating protein [Oscillospiraceae bacterium]